VCQSCNQWKTVSAALDPATANVSGKDDAPIP
jgi:hypothetical protein